MNTKIIYFSFIKYGGSDGPSVNETSFIDSLHAYGVKPVRICRGHLPSECDVYTIREFKNKILSYIYYCFLGLIRLFLCSRKYRNNFVVFRLSPLPLPELIFCLFSNSRFSIKTLGDGLITWKKGSFLGSLNLKMLKIISLKSQGIDTVSQKAKERIIEQLGISEEKVVVIDNAVDVHAFMPIDKQLARKEIGVDENVIIVGYTGNLPLERGGVDVINIVHDLIYIHKKNSIGLILGDDIGINELKNLVIKKNLPGKIFFPGRVPFNAIPTYVSALDLGVSILPRSKDGASGQKVRQYASCGIRIISSQMKDSFIEDMGIGKIIPQAQGQEISNAAMHLLSKTVDREKAHNYAVKYLSTESQLKKRIRHWKIEI